MSDNGGGNATGALFAVAAIVGIVSGLTVFKPQAKQVLEWIDKQFNIPSASAQSGGSTTGGGTTSSGGSTPGTLQISSSDIEVSITSQSWGNGILSWIITLVNKTPFEIGCTLFSAVADNSNPSKILDTIKQTIDLGAGQTQSIPLDFVVTDTTIQNFIIGAGVFSQASQASTSNTPDLSNNAVAVASNGAYQSSTGGSGGNSGGSTPPPSPPLPQYGDVKVDFGVIDSSGQLMSNAPSVDPVTGAVDVTVACENQRLDIPVSGYLFITVEDPNGNVYKKTQGFTLQPGNIPQETAYSVKPTLNGTWGVTAQFYADSSLTQLLSSAITATVTVSNAEGSSTSGGLPIKVSFVTPPTVDALGRVNAEVSYQNVSSQPVTLTAIVQTTIETTNVTIDVQSEGGVMVQPGQTQTITLMSQQLNQPPGTVLTIDAFAWISFSNPTALGNKAETSIIA